MGLKNPKHITLSAFSIMIRAQNVYWVANEVRAARDVPVLLLYARNAGHVVGIESCR